MSTSVEFSNYFNSQWIQSISKKNPNHYYMAVSKMTPPQISECIVFASYYF